MKLIMENWNKWKEREHTRDSARESLKDMASEYLSVNPAEAPGEVLVQDIIDFMASQKDDPNYDIHMDPEMVSMTNALGAGESTEYSSPGHLSDLFDDSEMQDIISGAKEDAEESRFMSGAIDEATEKFNKRFNDARNAESDILNALGKGKRDLSRAEQEKLSNVGLQVADGKISLAAAIADAKKELTESRDRSTDVELYTAVPLIDGVPGPLFSAPKSFPGALEAVVNVATNWQNAGFELDPNQTSDEVLNALSAQ